LNLLYLIRKVWKRFMRYPFVSKHLIPAPACSEKGQAGVSVSGREKTTAGSFADANDCLLRKPGGSSAYSG
jgi:hypothetical protein